MLTFREFYETDEIKNFLIKRKLLKQYIKSIDFLKKGILGNLDFKERQPKGTGIYSFRINKQFRAIGYFDNKSNFIVSKIDNHQ